MIGMDELMVSVHGEPAAISVAYDCEFEPKLAIVCPPATTVVGRKNSIGTMRSPKV